VHLKPRDDREESANEIIDRLRGTLNNVAGMRVYLQTPPTVRIGGGVSKSLYQFAMQSRDHPALYAAATKLEKALRQEPGIVDLTSDLAVTSPQVNVSINRDQAAAMGVTANAIEGAFYDAYGPRWVSTIYAAVNEYKVLLELLPEFQADPSALSFLYFNGATTTPPTAATAASARAANSGAQQLGAAPQTAASTGPVVPLDTLATVSESVGPQTISHAGQLAAVTLSFGLAKG